MLRRGAAALLSLAALFIAWQVGLPQRADVVGQIVGGLRVAPELGGYAPPLRLPGLPDEAWIDSSALPRPTLLNFWATWCEPCQRELPDLQQIHEEGLAHVLAINQGESSAVVQAWLQARSLSMPVALDEGRASSAYRVNGLPTTFLIAPDGTIGAIFYGAVDELRLRAALLPYHNTP